MGRQCIIEGCENILSERSKLDTCPACRATLCRWDKRPVAEVLERKEKLTMYRARMSTIVADEVQDTRKRGVSEPAAKQRVYRLTRTKFIPTGKAIEITGARN
jgi:hypothetical protein